MKPRTTILVAPLAAAMAIAYLAAQTSPPPAGGVRAWEEDAVIPTYLIGDPEPNPIFYFGRGSQGAQGRVYPYPLYDNLTYRKVDKKYKMVRLENQFVRITVLPEVGGRLFEAIDKTNGYNFVYRQHVIKPALIGLIGAWISGGIEWNIPHHHRATSALPVQYKLEENADGSKTIWVGELEVRSRMRWAVGYTLRPGKSYLEASVRILNRTPVVQTMLCFANLAVHVNDSYQVIFPPGTQFGTFHNKNQFTRYPIADGHYNGADFTKGVDISWYKNHPVANSVFAWNYDDDFFGGYDHGKQAGTMSIADHHVSPGKKFWTWGNNASGRQWDHILTDDDGPYMELMAGSYSDNQPDYSWLQPGEVKSFQQYWYPFRAIGGARNATLEAAVNLDVTDGRARIGFHATAVHPHATVVLKAGETILLEEKTAIGPAQPYTREVALPPGTDEYKLRVSLADGGRELVAYTPVRLTPEPMPKAVEPVPAPSQMATNEELYLAGLRIEQFYNASLDPLAYWREALHRDPGDTRVNTVMGIDAVKTARFADAEAFLRKALERLTDRYTTPKDAEAIYYLGLALKEEGKTEEAYDMLLKATWNLAWRAAAYYEGAEIAAARPNLDTALSLTDRSLEANALNVRALTLKAALLRHLNRPAEAARVLDAARRTTDPLDVRIMAEQWLLDKSPAAARAFAGAMNAFPATAQETAAEYGHAGLWQDATSVLTQAVSAAPDRSRVSPMVYYYLADFAGKLGDRAKALEYYKLAAQMPPAYVFPFQYEAVDLLRQAAKANPADARAPYYLGNLLFDWQPGEAFQAWEVSAARDPSFAIVDRNLAVAWSHQPDGREKAIAALEKAVSLDHKYALHFTELDDLYAAASAPPEKRLALLEQNHEVVAGRDDALEREIAMQVVTGKFDDAIRLMTGRHFAVWEGANLNVAEDWANAHLLRARRHLAAGRNREALADLEAATRIPDNLPAPGRGATDHAAEAAYFSGAAEEALGDHEAAKRAWMAAPSAEARPGRSGLANAAGVYYRAMALEKLGDDAAARSLLQTLLRAAGSGPDRPAQAHYAAGLASLGLGETDAAKREFSEALALNPAHLGARWAISPPAP
jgi:tetratricopeptide (TPR) repeat protein